jgi:hypothetical protein
MTILLASTNQKKNAYVRQSRSAIFIRVYNLKDNEALLKIYTNQTGCFPKESSLGNQYVMVLVELNSSAILVKAMKNCTSGKMIPAYQHLIDHL